jgi:hypothetical protein
VRRKAVSKNRRSNGRLDKPAAAITHEEALPPSSLVPRTCNTPPYARRPTQPPEPLPRTRISTPPADNSMASVRLAIAAPNLTTCDIDTDLVQQAPNQPRPYPGNYLPNGGAPGGPSGPAPGAVPLLPNQGRVIQQGSVRVLCIADVRGELGDISLVLVPFL